jgi:hypothetical protein
MSLSYNSRRKHVRKFIKSNYQLVKIDNVMAEFIKDDRNHYRICEHIEDDWVL